MSLLIFGLGYSAGAFVRQYGEAFAPVAGTRRKPLTVLHAPCPLYPFDGAEHTVDPQLAEALAQTEFLLVSAGPDAHEDLHNAIPVDPVLRRFGSVVRSASKLRVIVYLSTIGVYGDADGAWIDETAPTNAPSARAHARTQAEQGWLDCATPDRAVFILRLSGIYGLGRNAFVNLQQGSARRLIKPGQVFNRIHVDDIASTIKACFEQPQKAGVYNIADDEPAPPQDVITYAAELMGVAPPPEQDFYTATLTPMARSFYGANKRIDNTKMRRELGVNLAFPNYRKGLSAIWAQMQENA